MKLKHQAEQRPTTLAPVKVNDQHIHSFITLGKINSLQSEYCKGWYYGNISSPFQ